MVDAAIGAPIDFTWNPAGATTPLNGGEVVNANNFNVANFSSISVNTNTGSFTQVGAPNILDFLRGGTSVSSLGLGGVSALPGYSLYLTFSATGTLAGVPFSAGTTAQGSYTSFSYQLVGSTSGATSFSVSNGSVAINNPGTAQVLAYGSLVPSAGFLTLTNTGSGFSPSTNLNLSLNECLAAGQGGVCTSNQSGFFAAPAGGLHLAIGNFAATDSVTTTTNGGNTSFINTQGGGGNVTVGADFTWRPAGASTPLNGGDIVNANNIDTADFTSVSVNTNTGSFSEVGALDLLSFLQGGTSVSATGLGYSLYLPFTATGSLAGIPAVPGTSSAGTYTGLNYQLVGSTSGAPSFSVSNGSVAISNPGTTQVLAYGSLVPGTGFLTLTRTANGFSPEANFRASVNECAAAGQGGVCTSDELGFFVSPADLNLAIVDLTASDSVTTLGVNGSSAFLNIAGGGGNVTFEGSVSQVPEPSTLVAVLMGLLALSTVGRSRPH